MIRPGVRYIMLAIFFFTIQNVCIKFLPHIPAHEIIFFRCLVSLIVSYTQLRIMKINPWGNKKPVLILRGVFGVIALTAFFTTLQIMPLASAVTLHHLSPIFTIIFAIFILNEKTRPLQFLFFILAFLGVVMVRGFDDRITTIGLLLGITSALFSGLAYNMVRKSKKTEHPLVVVMYFPLVALPLISIWCFIEWVPPIGWDWLLLISIGLATQIAQVCLTRAFQLEKASTISVWQYHGLIYALAVGYFVFDETYSVYALLGMILIIGGILLNSLYENRMRKKAANS